MIPKGESLTDKAVKTLAQSEWKVLIQNKYPAYITWDIYRRNTGNTQRKLCGI